MIFKKLLIFLIVSIILFFSFTEKPKNILRLSSEIYKRKTIPNKYKDDTLIEYLILRPPVFKYIKYRGDDISYVNYKKSKLIKFPKWINNYKYLKAIDLIGNNKFNFSSELKKIKDVEKVEYLAISPKSVDSSLINSLVLFNNLKQLHIKKRCSKTDSLSINILKNKLQKCSINISIFADYGDIYFHEKK